MPAIPSYLKGYEALYAQNPRDAARAWFADARFGLFMHYGLYSLLGRGEWVLQKETVPLAEYEALKAGGHQVMALEGDKDLIDRLETFMPRVIK